MTNVPHSAFAGHGAPVSSYGWYPPGADEHTDRVYRLHRFLWIVVAVLGFVTFGASFGSAAGHGFAVQFSVLAAVVSAVGLLPKQDGRGWIVVALAVTGFLDALATWTTADEQWALTVVLVLNALQALAAVVALLYETRRLSSAEPSGGVDYSAYAQFAQSYQAYAAQYQQAAAAASYSAAGQATARAQSEGRAPAAAGTAAQEDPLAGLKARYARHGGDAAQGQQSRETAQGQSTPVGDRPGVPDVNHLVPESHPHRISRRNPGDGITEMKGS